MLGKRLDIVKIGKANNLSLIFQAFECHVNICSDESAKDIFVVSMCLSITYPHNNILN